MRNANNGLRNKSRWVIQHTSFMPVCQRKGNSTVVRSQASVVYSNPTQPRASTREYAVVGATEVPTPMKDLKRP